MAPHERKTVINSSCEEGKLSNYRQINEWLISETRRQFLGDFKKNSELYDKKDIDQICASDLLISRYLERQDGQMAETVDMMIAALRWRKKTNVSSLNAACFPREFYEIGAMFRYNEDKDGNSVAIFRACKYIPFPDFQDLMHKFAIHFATEIDDAAAARNNGTGWVSIFDMSNIGIVNIDIEMAMWMIRTFLNYFPAGIKRVYVVNMPWFVKGMAKTLMALSPAKYRNMIIYCSSKELLKYIDKCQLPDFLGGTCRMANANVPTVALPIDEFIRSKFCNYHLSDDQYKKFKQIIDAKCRLVASVIQ